MIPLLLSHFILAFVNIELQRQDEAPSIFAQTWDNISDSYHFGLASEPCSVIFSLFR